MGSGRYSGQSSGDCELRAPGGIPAYGFRAVSQKRNRHDAAGYPVLCSLFSHRSVIASPGTVFRILVGRERLAADGACASELLVSLRLAGVLLPPSVLTFRGAEPLREYTDT